MVPAGMSLYGEVCAWSLARAHARSGDRIAIAAYLGEDDAFARAVGEFAEQYADLNERDHAALAQASRTGRIETQMGL
jgi:anti-sigma-K factor RskA